MKVPISNVLENPYNSREDLGDLTGLKKQISKYGMLTPLPVKRTKQGYELAFGSRRLAALKELGEKEVEVSVHDFSDKDMMALSIGENIHRKDLTPAEQARAYEKGVRVAGTVEALSEAISATSSNIRKYLDILKLPKRILKREGELGIQKLYELSRLSGYGKGVLTTAENLVDNKDISAALLNEIANGCKIICDSNLPDKTKSDLCFQVMFEDYSKLAPTEFHHALKFAEGLLGEAMEKYVKRLQKTKKGREALKDWLGSHKPIRKISDVVDYDARLREITSQARNFALNIRKAHANHYYIRASTSSKNYFKIWVKKLFSGLEELVKDETKS